MDLRRLTRRASRADEATRPRRRGRSSLGFTVIAGIVLLLVFALVFSVAYGTQRITAHAGTLHTADETLLQATVVRAQLAIATHSSSVDREFGTNSTDAIALSVEETTTALDNVTVGLGDLADGRVDVDTDVLATGEDFVRTAGLVLAALGAKDSVTAQELAVSDLDDAFQSFLFELEQERAVLNEKVLSSDQQLGKIGNIARFLVAFVVPTAVILIYRELVRRQQRQGELERKLHVEQTLGKARDEFVANASHELRTPLTSIYGLALLLEEDPAFEQSDTAPELLDMIISESADLSRMVEDLLTTARLDAGALHYTFEDVEVLDEVDEVVGPMLRAGVDISVDCEPGIVRADRLRLRQVLRNLLSNARKYGGPQLRIEGLAKDGKFVCSVADNGDGIPKELEDRLFQRYIHRGHQPLVLGSVGLGLSIVNALTEGMGGAVRYERVGGLTRFVVTLPLVAMAERRAEPIDQDPIDETVEHALLGGDGVSGFDFREFGEPESYDVGVEVAFDDVTPAGG